MTTKTATLEDLLVQLLSENPNALKGALARIAAGPAQNAEAPTSDTRPTTKAEAKKAERKAAPVVEVQAHKERRPRQAQRRPSAVAAPLRVDGLTPEEIAEWQKVRAKCSLCHKWGTVLPDFGLRLNRGKSFIKQSWCKVCRGVVDYHPDNRVR